MRWGAAFLVLTLLTVPATAAETERDDCNEPCGYIVPLIDLDFPDKQKCGGGRLLYENTAPEDCEPLMAKGESWTIDGTIRIYWDAQEEPTYPILPTEGNIEVHFSGTQSNPDWIEMSFDPPMYEITPVDLYTLDNYVLQPEDTPIAWFEWERPVSVTFTRTGDPDAGWLKKIDDRNGVVANFMKARTTSVGQYYREAFGVEEFRFNAYLAPDVSDPSAQSDGAPTEDAPGFAPMLLLAALGVALIARRR